jgi:hypothetical protein
MPFVTTADNTRIHYEVTGRPGATPVLMIQGLGASKNGWNLQRAAMATRFRIIALDNRGAGRSDKPTSAFTLEQMADDAIAVLNAAGIEDAHICWRIDGRRNQPDHCGEVPRTSSFIVVGMHRVQKPPVAPRVVAVVGNNSAKRWALGTGQTHRAVGNEPKVV